MTTTQDVTTDGTTTAAPNIDGVELVHADPATLLVDHNIRVARLDRAFVASIKTHGVLMPVVAVRTTGDDGSERLRVRFGHRRALAAVEAGRPTIAVYVTGRDSDDTAEQIARIAGQFSENEHRTALTVGERVSALEQLALLGLSAAQIVRQTKAPKADVADALTVTGSPVARAAADRYSFLTLDQAAALAEFDPVDGPRDDDALTALVVAAKEGPVQFARALADAHEKAATRRARDSVVAPLRAAGVTVLDARPGFGSDVRRLEGLTDPGDPDRSPLEADAHAACPGHVAWLVENWERTRRTSNDTTTVERTNDDDAADDDPDGWAIVPGAEFGCSDPVTHGHVDRWGRRDAGSSSSGPDGQADQDAARETARAERRTTIANNKAMDTAAPIRREWVRTLLARKSAPKGTAAFLAASLAAGDVEVHAVAPSLLADLLGQTEPVDVDQLAAAATETRAAVVALAVVLAGYETQLTRTSWRNHWRAHHVYLGFLEAHGYPLSDVEALAAARDATEMGEPCRQTVPPASPNNNG